MDLSKCFDTLDHEIIMKAVAERISDGKVLGLIKKFLKSGVMHSNNFINTEVGSCQGGVISPLLSNIYLNQFDQKMMSKGIRIVRYADYAEFGIVQMIYSFLQKTRRPQQLPNVRNKSPRGRVETTSK